MCLLGKCAGASQVASIFNIIRYFQTALLHAYACLRFYQQQAIRVSISSHCHSYSVLPYLKHVVTLISVKWNLIIDCYFPINWSYYVYWPFIFSFVWVAYFYYLPIFFLVVGLCYWFVSYLCIPEVNSLSVTNIFPLFLVSSFAKDNHFLSFF